MLKIPNQIIDINNLNIFIIARIELAHIIALSCTRTRLSIHCSGKIKADQIANGIEGILDITCKNIQSLSYLGLVSMKISTRRCSHEARA